MRKKQIALVRNVYNNKISSMLIKEAKTNGFCFGVRKAIALAKKTANQSKEELYIIGDIVHNEKVAKEMEELGIKRVKAISQVPKHSTLLLKAHGSPPQIYRQGRKKGLRIIDATCPMVKEIHKKALFWEKAGWDIIIFGDKNHEEVSALCGYLKKPRVIENKTQAEKIKSGRRAALLCQSTQNLDEALAVLKILAQKIKEVVFLNTICQETLSRQAEVKHLAKKLDKIIVIGSKNSANTRRLWQIAKKINRRTFWLSTASDLKIEKFSRHDKIGLISGASTPPETIKEIKERLYSFYG